MIYIVSAANQYSLKAIIGISTDFYQDLVFYARIYIGSYILSWIRTMDFIYMNKGGKFLKELMLCRWGNKVIWLYQLSRKCKLATVTS